MKEIRRIQAQEPLLWKGKSKVVEVLSCRSVKPEGRAAVSTRDNEAALLKAAEKGDKGRVEELLKAGTNPNCCSCEVTKWTPLHWAANNGHETVVALLVRYNADVEIVDTDRETPLKLAIRKGKSKVVEVLSCPPTGFPP